MNCPRPHSYRLLFLLLIVSLTVQAQMNLFNSVPRPTYGGFMSMQVPVYRSKQDSLTLLRSDEQLALIYKKEPVNQKKVDSLMYLRGRIYEEGILGFRNIYYAHRGYLPFDSLKYITDKRTVHALSIVSKKMKQLPEEVLQCTNLEVLELVNCDIRKLQKELNTLSQLNKIQILNNKSHRKLKLFKNSTVKSFAIRGDNPRSLPKSFKKYEELTKIDLSENNLTRFYNGARHNRKLYELDMQRNMITLSKNNIRPHPFLERLGLQYNKIHYVPSSVKNLTNIKKIGLNHNAISDVAPQIAQLSKLEDLSFYNNKLEAVPEGVYEIRSLKVIDLFHNRIFKLEDKIVNWKKLHTLYASHNHLTYLPSVINQLPELDEIYVYDNALKELPASLCELPQLKVLRFNINEVKELPGCFDHLNNLEELDLSDNSITDLPVALFLFPKLKILAIVDNPWNEPFKNALPAMVKKLREQNVSVHLNSYGDEPEN